VLWFYAISLELFSLFLFPDSVNPRGKSPTRQRRYGGVTPRGIPACFGKKSATN
jgi:hypothetical protein